MSVSSQSASPTTIVSSMEVLPASPESTEASIALPEASPVVRCNSLPVLSDDTHPVPAANHESDHSLVRSILLGMQREDWQYIIRKWYGVDRSVVPLEDLSQTKRNKNIFEDHKSNKYGLMDKLVSKYIELTQINPQNSNVLDVAQIIQHHFNNRFGTGQYRIHVFEKVDEKCSLVWAGGYPSFRNIVVLRDDDTYIPIYYVSSLFRNKFYCLDCNKIACHRLSHTCDWTCRSCGRPSLICKPDPSPILLHCNDCGFSFASLSCYYSHRTPISNKSKRCGVVCQCVNCGKTYNKRHLNGEEHVCGETTYCQKCSRHCESSILHTCYTRTPTKAKRNEKKQEQEFLKILVYDFECMQTANGKNDYLGKHEVVCVAIRKACYNCFDLDKDAPCNICVEREKVISYLDGPNVLELFVDWLLQPDHNGRVLFAHNGGRYDHIILLEELVRRNIQVDLILKGCRIMCGKLNAPNCSMQIKDSYNLIPVPLGGFKKAFGLACDDKGEFPFLFIEKKNFHTITVGLPHIDFYNPDGKSPEKKKAFLQWHASHDPQYRFDFDSELLSYCKQDTTILLLGLMAYRKAMMTATDWDPLTHASTIASFTQHILRYDHIPAKTLVNIPENGYNFRRQQSEIALKWLKWTMHKEGIHIQHLENGGEMSFQCGMHKYYVDGWTPPMNGEQRGTIWEFLGCFWHGCKNCFRPEMLNKTCNVTYGALRAQTEFRLSELRKLHNVKVKWECDVRQELKSETPMQDFFHVCQNGRLLPRNAMQGGRTEAHARYAESSTTHKLVYYDVNSLYPTVMFHTDLPIGKPEIVTDNFPPTPCSQFNYEGIGYITILPPKNLRYPLLAVKMNNTLLFTLCRTCAAQHSSPPCHHTDEERAIRGTWTHLEIQRGLQLGYVITEFHEIWVWKTFSNALFKRYIRTFFKIKTESSGWPSWVKTREDQDAFMDKYLHEMCITIERDKVYSNPALRCVSKLLLNTSWGKYAQNPFVRENKITDGENMLALLDMKSPAVVNYKDLGNDQYLVSWENISEEVHSTPFGNLPIAIYITSSARLRLYDMLVASNGEALYNDTDSVIALIPRDDDPFSSMLGDSLGQLTDETPGKEIVKAVFGGPKQYALLLRDDQTDELSHILKIRGFSLDAAACETINFQSFHDLAMGITTNPLETERVTLKRKIPAISTIREKKLYNPVNDKGYRHSDDRIYPFGYEQPGNN